MIIIVICDPDCVRLVLNFKAVILAIIYKCLILELHTAACFETFKCRKVIDPCSVRPLVVAPDNSDEKSFTLISGGQHLPQHLDVGVDLLISWIISRAENIFKEVRINVAGYDYVPFVLPFKDKSLNVDTSGINCPVHGQLDRVVPSQD